jgi:hypothetical protein
MEYTMMPKDITPSQVQQWTEEIVTMLSRLARSRTHSDPEYVRDFLAKRNLTPEALFFLRIGLKSTMLAALVETKRQEGSYSDTGFKTTETVTLKSRARFIDNFHKAHFHASMELAEWQALDSKVPD